MTKPVGVQRKRTRGYNMQKHSRSINGLPAKSVCGPGKWGNPYQLDRAYKHRGVFGLLGTCEDSRMLSVSMFREYAEGRLKNDPQWLDPLRGHNLACFCKVGDPCHRDVLLELVNKAAE